MNLLKFLRDNFSTLDKPSKVLRTKTPVGTHGFWALQQTRLGYKLVVADKSGAPSIMNPVRPAAQLQMIGA